MHWVWNHSQTRGNSRLAVLAVADKVRTPACEIRVSYPEFMRALNVSSRTVVRDAIRKAEELGELATLEEGKGTRPALYRLPKAVGYARQADVSGTDSGLLEADGPARSSTDSGPLEPARGTDSGPLGEVHDRASSPDSVPQGSGIRTSSGPDSGPHYPSQSPKRERAIDANAFPAFARPLSDQLGLAGINVRWPFNETEWFKLDAAIKKSGIPALVDYARRSYERQNGQVDSARYFLRGWIELPPLPSPDAERPPLRAVAGGHQGWQPYTNPTDHTVYKNGW